MANNRRKIQIDLNNSDKRVQHLELQIKRNNETKAKYLLWQLEPRVWLQIY